MEQTQQNVYAVFRRWSLSDGFPQESDQSPEPFTRRSNDLISYRTHLLSFGRTTRQFRQVMSIGFHKSMHHFEMPERISAADGLPDRSGYPQGAVNKGRRQELQRIMDEQTMKTDN